MAIAAVDDDRFEQQKHTKKPTPWRFNLVPLADKISNPVALALTNAFERRQNVKTMIGTPVSATDPD